VEGKRGRWSINQDNRIIITLDPKKKKKKKLFSFYMFKTYSKEQMKRERET